MPVSIVLIGDHTALRQGLGLLLEQRGYDVLAACGDCDAARHLVEERVPDVVVVDGQMDRDRGIELTRKLVESDPRCRVVLYTDWPDPKRAVAGLKAGALGFAFMDGNTHELVHAVQAAAEDRLYVDPRIRSEEEDPPALQTVATRTRKALTRREREIMTLLAQGHTGEQVAALLVLSAETVKTHIRNAMVKLEATTRVHAIALGLRDGEISMPR